MNFKYRARTADGGITEGYIEAGEQRQALEILRGRGMVVINLNSQSSGPTKKKDLKSILNMDLGYILSGGKIPTKKLMIFFRQLSTMENAGLDLATSINLISEQEKHYGLKIALENIKNALDRGSSLSQAMSQQKAFSALVVSLVEAGEEGGTLSKALEQCAVLLEKQDSLKSRIRAAMFYPSFVMIFAIGVLIFFLVHLVPKFQEIFKTMNVNLPEVTLRIFRASEWFQANWKVLVISIAAVLFLLHFLSVNRRTKRIMDRLKMKIPVVKDIMLKSSLARSTRTFAALTSAGVPIVRGLEMSEGAAGSYVVQEGFSELRTGVSKGVSLGDSAKQTGVFPVLVSQMMRIGEETGHLDNMLDRVAAWYDQELDDQVKAATSLLEPLMIILVGVIVAVIAIAIFAPITSSIVHMA